MTLTFLALSAAAPRSVGILEGEEAHGASAPGAGVPSPARRLATGAGEVEHRTARAQRTRAFLSSGASGSSSPRGISGHAAGGTHGGGGCIGRNGRMLSRKRAYLCSRVKM